jgi:hypothetical protein
MIIYESEVDKQSPRPVWMKRLTPRSEVARFDKVGAGIYPSPSQVPSYMRHPVNVASNKVSLRMIAGCLVFLFVSRNMLKALSGT